MVYSIGNWSLCVGQSKENVHMPQNVKTFPPEEKTSTEEKSFFVLKLIFGLLLKWLLKWTYASNLILCFGFLFTVYVCDLDGSSLFHSTLISFVCLSMLYVGNKFAVLPLCVCFFFLVAFCINYFDLKASFMAAIAP